MKARTLSPRQAEYTTATDSLCLDQMRVFSAYLWEESIYAGYVRNTAADCAEIAYPCRFNEVCESCGDGG